MRRLRLDFAETAHLDSMIRLYPWRKLEERKSRSASPEPAALSTRKLSCTCSTPTRASSVYSSSPPTPVSACSPPSSTSSPPTEKNLLHSSSARLQKKSSTCPTKTS